MIKFSHSVKYQGLLLVLLLLGIECAFLASLLSVVRDAEEQTYRENIRNEVVISIDRFQRTILQAAQKMVQYFINHDTKFRDQCEDINNEILRNSETTLELVVDSPKDAVKLQQYAQLGTEAVMASEKARRLVDTQQHGSMLLEEGLMKFKAIAMLFGNEGIVERGRKIAQELENDQRREIRGFETRDSVLRQIYLGIPLNVGLAVVLAIYFTRRIARRLAIVNDNSLRLASGKPLLEPLKGNDEIAHADHSFHSMAEVLVEKSVKERAMIDKAVDVICSVDGEGKFIDVNPACLSVWGYSVEELIGRRLVSIVVESDIKRTAQFVSDMPGNRTVNEFENQIVRGDEKVIDVLWSATWSQEQNCIFCVAHDITQRIELERLKQQFLAMVSHDLRTPLTSIQFALTIVLEAAGTSLDEFLLEELTAAETNATSLITMINGLLDVEKIESGRFDLEIKRFSAAPLLKRAASTVKAFAEKHEVTVQVQPTECQVDGDEDRLLQVIVNLLSNAIKFSPAGSTVELAAVDRSDSVELTVRDHGTGVPKEFQDKIFDRFQQVKVSDAKVKGGSGLGLAICKALVEAHGGSIGVQSEEGKGSLFWLRVPKLKQVPPASPAEQVRAGAPGAAPLVDVTNNEV